MDGRYRPGSLLLRVLPGAVRVTYAGAVYLVAVVLLGGQSDPAGAEASPTTQLALTFAAATLVAVTLPGLDERLSRLLPQSPEDRLDRLTSGRGGTGDAAARLPELVRLVSAALGGVARITATLGAELSATWQWPPQGVEVEGERSESVVRPLVSADGRALGELAVRHESGRSLSGVEQRLLHQAAQHATALLETARMDVTLRRLVAESRARHFELDASRSRTLAAMEDERRRVERDIHDGAQQHLVALTVNLRLLQVLLERDSDRARVTAARVRDAVLDAIETLERLATGLYPRSLVDAGPVAALRAAVQGSPVPVVVQAEAVRRCSPQVEAAAYFSCLEAVQNALKHADADRVVVTLTSSGGDLAFEVSDDGRGFEASEVSSGSGTSNLRDRIASLGGRLAVTSAVGEGTTVRGWIPAYQADPADPANPKGITRAPSSEEPANAPRRTQLSDSQA